MNKLRAGLGFVAVIWIGFSGVLGSAWAGNNGQILPSPDCLKGTQKLEINNEQMLKVKSTQRNQYLDRGNVYGAITRIFDVRGDHDHFEINIGTRAKDVVEVVYNHSFGPITLNLRPGMKVQVCGDFINSFAPTGRYPASPSGAIIHWTHLNPSEKGHEHGFLSIDSHLFGYDWDYAHAADNHGGKNGQKPGGAFQFWPSFY